MDLALRKEMLKSLVKELTFLGNVSFKLLLLLMSSCCWFYQSCLLKHLTTLP